MDGLNFRIIQDDFDKLLTATKNYLEREWSVSYPNELVNGGKFTISNLYQIAIANYRGVIALCKIGEEQQLNLYFGTPSLNRGIVENLFTLVYLLSDFVENNKLFIKNSVREKKELLDFYQDHYGEIPKWMEYLNNEFPALNEYQNFVDEIVGFTNEEKTNMKNMKRFPRVSGIVKYLEKKSHPDLKFFRYLENLHYIKLSHLAHSTPSGLVEVGNLIENPKVDAIEDFINEQRWIAVSLIMSLTSEIEIHFNYGLKPRISYIWEFLQNSSEYSQEIYNLRYRKLLVQ